MKKPHLIPKRWMIIIGSMMLTMRLFAPVFTIDTILTISNTQPNLVSVTVTSTNFVTSFESILQISTNLAAPNWIDVQTGFTDTGVIVFTNIPATNAYQFFRTGSYFSF